MIGVIDHHTLQVERPDQVADLIREGLKYIPPEGLIISSDCGMGREGMSRRHATYQDGRDGAGDQHRQKGARTSGSRVPGGRPALFARNAPIKRTDISVNNEVLAPVTS